MGFFAKLFGINQSSVIDLETAISEGAFLVDVRSKSEFESGTAKGAVNIPVEIIAQKLDQLKGKSNIVVFCRSGNRSAAAKRILESKGLKNVINGGTWQQVAQTMQQQ
ncbi:MAG: rhodanese-like domain-containing protein [Chitinophagaceae bacterium]